MAATLITSEIDLDAEGKHVGFLRVPHSVDRSAYGWIGVPIVSVRNGSGPTVLLLAGNHGDEYEGQIALTKLARELTVEGIRGQVVIVTMTNAPAAQAGCRVSPLDDGNLNRSFPGDPSGTPTQMIADYIETVLLPCCDVMVDLHSGGKSLFYPPTLLRGRGTSEDEARRLQAMQEAFDLPFAWGFGGGGRDSTGRTAMAAANRNGVVSVMAELGGGGGVDREILAATERGLRRILHGLGMLPGYTPDAQCGTRELVAKGSIYCHDAGLFEPFKDIAEPVAQGETVGLVHQPLHPLRDPIEIVSPYDGIVLCKRAMGQVELGDAVYQIAEDLSSDM